MSILLLFLISLEVSSQVDSVTVYQDRALIVREGTVRISGEEFLSFPGLPGILDDQSVRVKAPGLKIGEVQIKKGYARELPPRVKELEEKIKRLEKEDETLGKEIEVIKDKEKFLLSISVGAPEVISKELLTGKVEPGAWRAGLNFMSEELTKARLRLAEIERIRKDLNERIDALKRELQDTKAIVENRKEICFAVYSSSPDDYELQLSYFIPQAARWTTYYELRAMGEEDKIDLSYFARLSQNSGEDWVNSKIVLSTAVPALGGMAPEPQPWYLRPRPQYKAEKAMAPRVAMMVPTTPRVVLAEESAQTAPLVEAGISLQYPLPGRMTVKSGEPEKKVSICQTALPARFEYYILPRVVSRTYLQGKIQNASDYIFIGGEGGTYVGGDFTGKIFFPNLAPQESTAVSFGVDERVKVKRELLKSFVVKSGSRLKREVVYRNTVENFQPQNIDVTLIDQIPVSQHSDIKVKDVSFSVKPAEEDKEKGIYYWKEKLNPKQKFLLDVSFTIEYPEEMEIEGALPPAKK
ncbi:MAG: mucoidy inhibitor MuiA family protein [Candidatus Edwardsbacteria bacterium]